MMIIALIILVVLGAVIIVYISYRKRIANVSLNDYVKSLSVLPKDNTTGYSRVMCFQISSYPQGKEPKYARIGSERNAKYCKKWGYTYELQQHPFEAQPVYWIRVDQLHKLMNSPYEYLVYMDLDAMFVHTEWDLVNLCEFIDKKIKRECVLYVSEDPGSLMNSGVIIVKNCPLGRQIIRDWYEYCFCEDGKLCNHCSSYKFQGQKWECPECGIWAQYGYEQYALSHLYEKYKQHMCILSSEFLGRSADPLSHFILHLFGIADDTRLEIMQSIDQQMPVV